MRRQFIFANSSTSCNSSSPQRLLIPSIQCEWNNTAGTERVFRSEQADSGCHRLVGRAATDRLAEQVERVSDGVQSIAERQGCEYARSDGASFKVCYDEYAKLYRQLDKVASQFRKLKAESDKHSTGDVG